MLLEYRGFVAKICFDVNTKTYYGWAVRDQQIISFQSSTKRDLLNAMQHSVHSILEYDINEASTLF